MSGSGQATCASTAGCSNPITPRSLSRSTISSLAGTAVRQLQGGRPHWTFRGLLNVHSRYGLSACCIAKATHLSRRLRRFRYLHRRSDSYRLERPGCRVGIAPTEDQHLSTAHFSDVPFSLIPCYPPEEVPPLVVVPLVDEVPAVGPVVVGLVLVVVLLELKFSPSRLAGAGAEIFSVPAKIC